MDELPPLQKIIHIDMDAFFAAIEQRDNPDFRDKPLAVGGSKQRGVVAAASYEARKFGIHSAMPSAIAFRKCPEIIFVKPRFEVYKQVSNQIRAIFLEYTDLVEPLSLDEAYLDVTQDKKSIRSATLIAQEIKERIKQTTGLTASAGVSFNKFLAKVASDFEKPNGLTLIRPEDAEKFVAALPIAKFHGIGKVTAEKMYKLGIQTGADLRKHARETLHDWFGKAGLFYFDICRGVDHRKVNPTRLRKSLGAERTFEKNYSERETLMAELDKIADTVWARLQQAQVRGKTITVKIKFANFVQITRSRTFSSPLFDAETIKEAAFQILQQTNLSRQAIRLLGITLSNLSPVEDIKPTQLKLLF